MGRAQIWQNKTNGLYQIEVLFNNKTVEDLKTRVVKDLAAVKTRILTVNVDRLSAESALKAGLANPSLNQEERLKLDQAHKAKSAELALLKAQKIEYESTLKQCQKLLDRKIFGDAWCADFSNKLTGIVDTIEPNGVLSTDITIAPGGKLTTKSQLVQTALGMSDAAFIYNWVVHGAWQKNKPTYRICRITQIDYKTHKCTVCLEDVNDKITGKNVNQEGDGVCSPSSTSLPTGGYLDYCFRNPASPACTNCGSATVTMTPAMWSAIERVQREVNKYPYAFDEARHKRLEYWEPISTSGAGDCEDYALEKFARLVSSGVSKDAMWIEGGFRSDGAGHAWLVVKTDKGEWALDNLQELPVKNSDQPYSERVRFFCGSYVRKAPTLNNVTIKYLNCDSLPFRLQDRVMVEFESQDWKKPKVIGFAQQPRPCTCPVDCDNRVFAVLKIAEIEVGDDHIDNKCDVDKPALLNSALTEDGLYFKVIDGGPCGRFLRVNNISNQINCPPYDYTISNWAFGCDIYYTGRYLYFPVGFRPLEQDNFTIMWVHRNDADPMIWKYVVRAWSYKYDGNVNPETWPEPYPTNFERPWTYDGPVSISGSRYYGAFKTRFYNSLGSSFYPSNQNDPGSGGIIRFDGGMQIDWYVCKWWSAEGQSSFVAMEPDEINAIDRKKWHCSAITFSSGNKAKIYLDGKLKAQSLADGVKRATCKSYSEFSPLGGQWSWNNPRPFSFFSPPGEFGNESVFWKGDLGFLAIFNVALTDTEITAIYNDRLKFNIDAANGV